jgi:hypothetical protein
MPTPASSPIPDPPSRQEPRREWEHFGLYERVRNAIKAIPLYFRSETFVAGVMATDLHNLNAALGAAIEDQATATLNAMRRVWDPEGEYPLAVFLRQPQTFPDVILYKEPQGEIILGIELKGWYLLSKEGEPSYRYQATEAACTDADLLVVVPWALASVLSGRPVVFDPQVELARYAAQARNHYWEHTRQTNKSRKIIIPAGVKPYPSKADQISDKAEQDRPGNFGRLARSGIVDMKEYFNRMLNTQLCGVRVTHWLDFLTAIGGKTEADIRKLIGTLSKKLEKESGPVNPSSEALRNILDEVQRLAGIKAPQE